MIRKGRLQTRTRKFAFDDTLRREFRYDIDPNAPVCPYYSVSACHKGLYCRDRHILNPNIFKIVCRHWLRGLCKLGDHCEYVHELDMSRVTECPNIAKNGQCNQIPECPFKHPHSSTEEDTCAAYDKGFCKLGAKCPKPHLKRDICLRYLTGFCPLGPSCDNAHPKFMQIDDTMRISRDKLHDIIPVASSFDI